MISVIMASYLGHYPGASSNRDVKFRRAIDSFLKQGIGELIIVSDGCDQTIKIASEYNSNLVKVVPLPKQPLFSGKVRQEGIKHASYDWICYLDSDDMFLPTHLSTLVNNIDQQYDWFFWNDIVVDRVRNCEVSLCRIGTSCIMHKKSATAVWPDGYNHDWGFIQQLGKNYKKIENAGYVVMHIPNSVDL